jgi:hypothetical protein
MVSTSHRPPPIAVFSNSDGDLQMLQWTVAGQGHRFCLYVHHTDTPVYNNNPPPSGDARHQPVTFASIRRKVFTNSLSSIVSLKEVKMRTTSTTVPSATWTHTRTPGVIALARDLKILIYQLSSIAKRLRSR